MSIIDKIRSAFTTKEFPSSIFETSSYDNKIPPERKESEYLKEMKGWVFSCVRAISENVGSTRIRLYKYKPNGETEEVYEHQILDLIYRVNAFTTKFDHLQLTQTYLELTGECPWYLEREGKDITNIYILRPDRMTVLFDKENIIGGYEYEISARKKELFTPDEIIFFKYPNPDNLFRGLGTLQAAARTVDIDNFSEEWNKKFYYNSARPDGILFIKVKKLTEEQRKRIKKSVNEGHRGTDKAHRMMVLSGDMDYKQLGMSQKDMDFLEQQKFSRDKILGIFGVPKAILAQTDGVNFANAKVAESIFAKWTIKPKLERLIEQMNEFLVPMFPDGDKLYLDYDTPVPEDVDIKLKGYESGLKNGYITINEVRNNEGFKPLEGDAGDKIYLPQTLVPIGEVKPIKSIKNSDRISSFKARTYRDRQFDEVRLKIKEMVRDSISKKHKIKTEGLLDDENKKVFWDSQIKIADVFEYRYKKKFNEIFEKQKKKIVKSVKKSINYDLLDPKEEIKQAKVFVPLEEELILKEGQIALDLVSDKEFDLDSPIMREFIDKRPKVFIKEMAVETNDLIKKEITKGIKEGEGILKIKRRISDMFDGFEYRAERAARSEVIRASGFATEQAYIQSDVVKYKEWLTEFDNRTCEWCMAMNGKKMKLGESFYDKGDALTGNEGGILDFGYESIKHPPLHVSCRCSLIPVVTGSRGYKLQEEVEKIKKIKIEGQKDSDEISKTKENLKI